MGLLSEYRELEEIEAAMSRSPNSGLTECTYGCGLNLEHCSKSPQLGTGYMYIYKKAESASGLLRFVGSNFLARSVAITSTTLLLVGDTMSVATKLLCCLLFLLAAY